MKLKDTYYVVVLDGYGKIPFEVNPINNGVIRFIT